MEFTVLNIVEWSTTRLETVELFCGIHLDYKQILLSLESTLGLGMGISFLMFLTFKQQLCCQPKTFLKTFVAIILYLNPIHRHRLTRVVASTHPSPTLHCPVYMWLCFRKTIVLLHLFPGLAHPSYCTLTSYSL